jgi:ubiquinone/menaquinone biosynthesis C-methylase UbiE
MHSSRVEERYAHLRMATDFERQRKWWDAQASTEDQDRDDESINRALRWREIERHLEGVRTILDIGGGTGAFSIPLAKRGLKVTHVDLSPQMLERARAKAKADGLTTIEFVEANAVDLSRLGDGRFDLVLNLDGAVSFCGPAAKAALHESARLTGRTLIVTVSHRAWMAAASVGESLQTAGDVLPSAQEMFDHGQGPSTSSGGGDDFGGAVRSFLPEELAAAIRGEGLYVERVGGLGSLSLLAGPEAVRRATSEESLLARFVDLADRFDREIMPQGPGTRQRAGLIAVAHRA